MGLYATYASDMAHKKTCVYRMYDGEGTLLYVGMSLNPRGRWETHKRRHWWIDVEEISLEWFSTRDEARLAERSAIHHENPLHNLTRPRMECC